MASKITSWCQCSSWRQKVRHDINKYIMMLKVMEVKVMSWRQKVRYHVKKYVIMSKSTLSHQKVRYHIKKYVITSKSMLCVCQSYVMTSKVCHDVKKYSYIITSKVRQKVHYDVKKFVMTSMLHQDVKIRHDVMYVKVTLWRQKG